MVRLLTRCASARRSGPSGTWAATLTARSMAGIRKGQRLAAAPGHPGQIAPAFVGVGAVPRRGDVVEGVGELPHVGTFSAVASAFD